MIEYVYVCFSYVYVCFSYVYIVFTIIQTIWNIYILFIPYLIALYTIIKCIFVYNLYLSHNYNNTDFML
jgi:hypothetical protein